MRRPALAASSATLINPCSGVSARASIATRTGPCKKTSWRAWSCRPRSAACARFGKKQSLLFVNEEGDTEREDQVVVREDFWTSTSNKQLNFVQHIYTLLRIDGRAAVVVPDNVLFEGGAGEKVRRNLLQKGRVHTLLRLPTGIWYSPGVKANVIFFEKKEGRAEPWTDKFWVYDLRTNLHFTLKQSPIQRDDFTEFIACYQPGKLHERRPTWGED